MDITAALEELPVAEAQDSQRYLLRTTTHGFHAATLSMGTLVAHINATPSITGTVLEGTMTPGMVRFRPDGWPLPEGVYPEGFMVEPHLLELIDDGDVRPIQYATPQGRKVWLDEAKNLVREYLEDAGPFVFVGISKREALGSL